MDFFLFWVLLDCFELRDFFVAFCADYAGDVVNE